MTLRSILSLILCLILLAVLAPGDVLFNPSMPTHVTTMLTIPSSATDVYTQSVWLVSIEFIPQSTTSPTCTVQDKAGTPNIAYNTVALSPNHSYRDERQGHPLFMSGGITWSCSDTTVKGQIMVQY